MSKQMFDINFAVDWIRTADLWYRKRPLYLTNTALFFVCSQWFNLWFNLMRSQLKVCNNILYYFTFLSD